MRVDAAGLGAEVQVRLQEGAVRFVGLARLHNHLGNRVLTAIQETFCEARLAVVGLGIRKVQLVKSGCN